jgi:hypothetical protein
LFEDVQLDQQFFAGASEDDELGKVQEVLPEHSFELDGV